MASQVDPVWHDRIVHATLQLGDVELTGVDQLPRDYGKPQGFCVTLTIQGATRAQEIFTALAEKGEIRRAFQQTFWSPGFGVLTDQFGVPWEINSVDRGVPPNQSLERTHQTVIKFAYANLPPAWRAAQLRC